MDGRERYFALPSNSTSPDSAKGYRQIAGLFSDRYISSLPIETRRRKKRASRPYSLRNGKLPRYGRYPWCAAATLAGVAPGMRRGRSRP
jgi:hypothetical protein